MTDDMARKTTKRGTDTPAGRLIKARENAGYTTAVEACDKLKFSHSTYAQHESGARGLKNAAAQYAKAFGVTEEWLLHGDGGPPASREIAAVRQPPAISTRDFPSMRPGDGVTVVRRYSGNGDAGHPVPFPDALLTSHGMSGRNCMVVQIDKSTETGGLSIGDFVLLDTSDVDPTTPGLFAVEDKDVPFAIRQLQYLVGMHPARLLVTVDGPQPYQYDVEQGALRIIGRVRWIAKSP